MNRIDRLTALLVHLQGKPRIPIEELEMRFEVSRRTVFRDIRSLIEAGVPIGGDAGEGYFIVEGYHLPPVVFNKEEAAALLMGAKFIEKNADHHVLEAFHDAMYKIKAVLRYSDKEYLDSLENSITVLGSPTLHQQSFPDSHLAELQLALATHKVIHISYYSNYNEQTTDRDVEPLGLVYYSGRWHLIGYCRLREDMRDFRSDRIQRIKVTNENFEPKKHPKISDFTQRMLGGTDAKQAILRFTKKVSRFIQDQKFHYGFVEEKKTGDFVEMKFATPAYEFLAQWVLTFGNKVEVVAPNELRMMAIHYSRQALEHHQKNSVPLEEIKSG